MRMVCLSIWLNGSTVPFAGGWYGVVLFGLLPHDLISLVHS